MYPVTKAVADQFKTNARQNLSLLVNPVVGESFELTSADILSAGLNINRYSATGDSVALGVCSAADLSLRVENGDGRFNDVVFEGAQIYASVGVEDGNNTQWVPLGYFTVDNAPRRLAVISITALDGMVQFDKLANRSALSLPNSVKNIVLACCNECNITIDTDLDALPNSSFVAQSVGDAEDLTYRTILQWCCQVMGVNGYMDWDGHLELSWYKKDGIPETVSGSIATFESVTEVPVNNLTVPITAVQSFNGYDKPWVGGAGKNKLNIYGTTYPKTVGDVTFTSPQNGVIVANGTATEQITMTFAVSQTLTAGDIVTGSTGGSSTTYGIGFSQAGIVQSNAPHAITANQASVARNVYIRIESGVTMSNVSFYPMIRSSGTSDTFEPYENICPIYPANGKNYFDSTQWTDYNVTKAYWGGNCAYAVDVLNSLPVGTYTFSFKECVVDVNNTAQGTYGVILRQSINGQNVNIYAYLTNYAVTQANTVLSDAVTFTLTSENVGKFTNCYLYSGFSTSYVQNTARFYDIQIERGIATSYVPYRAFDTTSTGKNLLDDSRRYFYYGNVYFGGATTKITTDTVPSCVLPAGTYTFTVKYDSLNNTNIYAVNMSDGTNITGFPKYGSPSSNITSQTFTLTESTSIVFWTYNASLTGASDVDYAQVEAGYTATAYEPYQGKQYFNFDYNFWDEEYLSGYYNVNDGTFVPVTSRFCSKNYIPVVPSTTYFAKTPSSGLWLLFYDADKTYLGQSVAIFRTNATFTAPSNAYYMQFYAVASYGGTYQNDIQFNYSDPSQVGYGGTLNVTTGVLTVTHKCVDLADWKTNWTKSTSYPGGFYRTASNFGFVGQTPFICSHAKTVTALGSYVFGTCYCDNSINIRIMPNNATVQDWYDYIQAQHDAGTPIVVCAKLSTPQIYQLTPAQVELLKGINNIWADNGTVSVTFPEVTTITPADRYNSDIFENPVTITGVSVKGKENQAVAGSEDYALAIDGNALITDDDVETIANGLSGLIGFSYHPFSASVLPMPYLYPLDMVAVQYKGEWYDCAITEINFTSTAPTQLKGTGESAQSRSYARINPLTNRERAIIENLKDEMNTTLNKAVNNIIDFNNIISNALGLYHTNVADGSGGFIRYLHDAPDLESSTYIVTETAQGFAWTTNGWNGGSPIWQYGVTSGGYALFKWLSAEGIDVTRASSDYRAEVTPEHFNIYYKNDLIITIDATDRAIQTPRMVIPYSSTSINSLRVGQLVWIPTPNGANAVVLGG